MTPCLNLGCPFTIGSVTIPNRVVLGPMAGVTCRPFRRHLKVHGVGLVHTEMVSAHGILYGNARTLDYLDFAEEERPLSVQLFAGTPDAVSRAAARVLEAERRPDIIDINMGCPVRKVVKTGAGAALLGDIDRAVAVAAAVVRTTAAAGIPVTVKLRSGLVAGDGIAEDLAPRLEAVGVAALALHARAATDFYRGRADHEVSARVASRISIPLVISGDVDSLQAAEGIVDRVPCAALMLARGVLGNPWLVEQLLTARSDTEPSARGGSYVVPREVAVDDLLRLFARARSDMGDEAAVRWIRSHVGWYLRRQRVRTSEIHRLRLIPEAGLLEQELMDLARG